MVDGNMPECALSHGHAIILLFIDIYSLKRLKATIDLKLIIACYEETSIFLLICEYADLFRKSCFLVLSHDFT